jgi:hypothetical protein
MVEADPLKFEIKNCMMGVSFGLDELTESENVTGEPGQGIVGVDCRAYCQYVDADTEFGVSLIGIAICHDMNSPPCLPRM